LIVLAPLMIGCKQESSTSPSKTSAKALMAQKTEERPVKFELSNAKVSREAVTVKYSFKYRVIEGKPDPETPYAATIRFDDAGGVGFKKIPGTEIKGEGTVEGTVVMPKGGLAGYEIGMEAGRNKSGSAFQKASNVLKGTVAKGP